MAGIAAPTPKIQVPDGQIPNPHRSGNVRQIDTYAELLGTDTPIAANRSPQLKGPEKMNMRLSHLAIGMLVVATISLIPGRSWAVYHPLGPSKDDWGLKYDIEVKQATGDALSITFTLADHGRLVPVYSITLIALSKPHSDGGRSYLVKAPIELKAQGRKLAGQVRIPREHAEIAVFRILTLTVDGRPQTSGAAYYDIPLKKFLDRSPESDTPPTPSATTRTPASKVTK